MINSKKIFQLGLIHACIILILSGCKKDPGVGGTTTLTGKLYTIHYYSSFQGNPVETLSTANKEVYIIYGSDHNTYDDHFKTSYDGSYEFKYLRKGDYKLFAYSKDSTGAYNGNLNNSLPNIPVLIDVNINKNGITQTIPNIYILDNDR